jgi:hypothetical protein
MPLNRSSWYSEAYKDFFFLNYSKLITLQLVNSCQKSNMKKNTGGGGVNGIKCANTQYLSVGGIRLRFWGAGWS